MENDVYPMNERRLKYLELGIVARVLLDLHFENPKLFNVEKVVQELVNEYEKLGLQDEIGHEDD